LLRLLGLLTTPALCNELRRGRACGRAGRGGTHRALSPLVRFGGPQPLKVVKAQLARRGMLALVLGLIQHLGYFRHPRLCLLPARPIASRRWRCVEYR